MTKQIWPALKARGIVKRVVVRGELVFQSPVHLGSGESSDVSDMPLLTAPDDEQTPLLTGASLAGALRSYLRSRELGGFRPERGKEKDTLAVCLFGDNRFVEEKRQPTLVADDGKQSALIVEDAYGQQVGIEQRPGVRRDPATGTAADNLLFDAQYWQAGTAFPLVFELLVCQGDDEPKLLRALAAALQGLERGEIALGARKQRGFGQCAVANWQVDSYDLAQTADLLAWLEEKPASRSVTGTQIAPLLGVTEDELPDRRRSFSIKADFAIEGSLMIRSAPPEPGGADSVHLHSQRGGKPRPVVSGSSLGGALRARAGRIAAALELKNPQDFVDQMFGPELVKGSGTDPYASRLRVAESVIEHAPENIDDELVQNRVKIDRFTGGAFPTALFAGQPVFAQVRGGQPTVLTLTLTLHEPSEAQVGMLLLLLKDLWTGDLPLGGESSVGRGRLRGLQAEIVDLRQGRQQGRWCFHQQGQGAADPLVFSEGGDQQDKLQRFVDALTGKEVQ